jgi:hypothetical protein
MNARRPAAHNHTGDYAMINVVLLNVQPIAKFVVAIVNLEPLLKSAWLIIMLAFLSEYFAEFQDEPKNL